MQKNRVLLPAPLRPNSAVKLADAKVKLTSISARLAL
jgi:hypothetical protein